LSGGTLVSFGGYNESLLDVVAGNLNYFNLSCSSTLNAIGGSIDGGVISSPNANFVVPSGSTALLTGDILGDGAGDSGNVIVQTNWAPGALLGSVLAPLNQIQISDGNMLTISHGIAATNIYLGSGSGGSSLLTDADNLVVRSNIDGTSGFSSSHIGALEVANPGVVIYGDIGSATPLSSIDITNRGTLDVSGSNGSINANQTTIGFRSTLTIGSGQLTGLVDGNDFGFGTLIFAGNNSTNGAIGSNYSLNTVGVAASKTLTSSDLISTQNLILETGAELCLQDGASFGVTPAVTMASGSHLDLSDAGSQTIGTLSGLGTISLGSHTLTTDVFGTNTFSGSIQDGGISGGLGGSFTVSGNGTQILSGANSYTGTTTLNTGTLILSGNGSIASSIALVNDGVFDISQTTSGAVIQNLSGSGIITLGSESLTVEQDVNQTFSGSIQGLGSLTKSGTGILTLNGINTYQGGTTVTDGSIEIGPDGSIIGGIVHAGNSVFNQSQGTVDSLVSSSTAISTLSGGVLESFVGLDTATLNMSGDSTLNFFGLVGGATLNASGGVVGGGAVSGSDAGFVVTPGSTVSLTGDILGGGNSGSVIVQNNWTPGAQLGVFGQTLQKIQVSDGSVLTISHDIAATNIYLGSGAEGSSLSTGANNLVVTGNINGTSGFSSSHLGTLNVANSGFVVSGNIGSSTPLDAINIANSISFDVSGNDSSINASQITLGSGSMLKLGSGQLTGLVDGNAFGSGTLQFAATQSTNGAIGSTYALNTVDIKASKTLTSAYAINTQNLALETGAALYLQSGASLGETPAVSMASGSNIDISSAGSQTLGALSGSGTISLGAHTLSLDVSGTNTFSGTIQDGGLSDTSGASFVVTGTGNQILAGINEYSGSTTINSGRLTLSGEGSINSSSALVNNGIFDISQATSNASIKTLSGSGSVVLGANDLTISQNSNQSFSGSIDGLGSLTKSGNSTLNLTGTSSYQGGTTFAEGTVAVFVDSNLGNASAPLTFNGGSLHWQQTDSIERATSIESGGGSINLDSGVILDFSGPVTGSGNLVKTGSGRLQLVTADSSAFTGLTSIEDGELKLNAVLGGNITISGSGAFLSGTGTILGNLVVNQGRLAPGNSIGTINVGGDLTQESTSTYYVQLNELGQSTLTNVTGSATINNATLDVTSLTGLYNIQQPYTIITAQEGITGQYGNIVIHQLALIPSTQISDDNLSMLLNFQRSFLNAAATSNQESVAQQLQTIANPTQEQSDLLNDITAINGTPIQYAFDQLSGQQYTNLLIGVEESTRQVVRTQYNQLRDLAAAPIGCQLDKDDRDVSFWVEGSSSKGTYANTDNNLGFKSDGVSASIGLQREINFDSTLGASLTYENSNLKDNLGIVHKSYTLHQHKHNKV
jgi:autotransporter-associated beta strand protein